MYLLNSETSDKTVFLPGRTSDGHHQIELACGACHGESFTDRETIQEACMNCHGEALEVTRDKHPKSKFTDPRNADRVALLDARECATCHVEHRPDITLAMGLTLPADYCELCHFDIAEDRPSHEGMGFETCASAGCHNFHDNQALYEDFLVKHANESKVLEKQSAVPPLNFGEIATMIEGYPVDEYPLQKLELRDADGPAEKQTDAELMHDWFTTAHAQAGVNCGACHETGEGEAVNWTDHPDHTACRTCHKEEVNGFFAGRHGMRLDQEKLKRELSPMTPAMARLPMKHDAMDKTLECNTCHGAHRFDIRKAAVESCLGCHDDTHTKNYIDSPHHELWKQELAGEIEPGLGVSCATCHMPRTEKEYFWGEFYHTLVQHNQSDTMRPNEKMIRPVCMNCHGLGFSIDALADNELIENNFSNSPGVHIEGIEMAIERAIEAEKKKQREREANASIEES